MAQETIPVQGLGSSAAPLTYKVAVGDSFDLMAAFASFNGTGAGSSWVPALQVIAPSGAVMVSTIGATVAAGGTADVTFAPFLENDTGGGGACGGLIDSTATAGNTCGVHSAGQGAGLVLTSNGANGSTWSPGGGGYTPNPNEEWLQVVAVSIPGMTTTRLTWSHLAGAALLNLAGPTAPSVIVRGVYTLDITAVVTTNATTTNHFQMDCNAVQAFTGAVHAQDVFSSVLTDAIQGSLSLTGRMLAGDTYFIDIFNMDTVARTFSCPSVRVTKILEF